MILLLLNGYPAKIRELFKIVCYPGARLFGVKLVKEEFESAVSLGAEGDLGAEAVEFALADGGDESGDAVTEVGLSPGPAATQGMVVGKPGDGANGPVGVGGGIDIENGALVEIDIGCGVHPP